MKKIFYLLIISLLIITGCGKNNTNNGNNTNNVGNENTTDKVIKDIEVESSEKININTSQLIERDNNKIIRAEISTKDAEQFNQMKIKFYNENNELIKESLFEIDVEVTKGQVFIIEEDYNHEEKIPHRIVVETYLVENDEIVNNNQMVNEETVIIENE